MLQRHECKTTFCREARGMNYEVGARALSSMSLQADDVFRYGRDRQERIHFECGLDDQLCLLDAPFG
jgi:hypothetical protein